MPLADPDPFVIRGGLFAAGDDVLAAVRVSIREGDGPVASVWVGSQDATESYGDALRRVCAEGQIPNGKVRIASLLVLRSRFRVMQDQKYGEAPSHHNVLFSDPPTLGEAEEFVNCFADPIPNPAKN